MRKLKLVGIIFVVLGMFVVIRESLLSLTGYLVLPTLNPELELNFWPVAILMGIFLFSLSFIFSPPKYALVVETVDGREFFDLDEGKVEIGREPESSEFHSEDSRVVRVYGDNAGRIKALHHIFYRDGDSIFLENFGRTILQRKNKLIRLKKGEKVKLEDKDVIIFGKVVRGINVRRIVVRKI